MNRRQFLLSVSALGFSATTYAGLKIWPEQGFHNPCLSGLPDALKHHPLMAQIWVGIDPTKVWDTHVHLVGVGDTKKQGEKPWFNPNMDSHWHPILKAQKHFYMNGSCAIEASVDDSTVQRMADLCAEMPAGVKLMLFAFDWLHDENGNPQATQSMFHVPNDYAANIASEYSHLFEWVASIHPYRKDAVNELARCKKLGARAVKWIPSGMGIDPASPKCDAFYAACKQLNMPIICHTGRESAVQGGRQEDGNPLKLRRALEAGVRVVLAHCASDGEDIDFENGHQNVQSFDLFARLMSEPKYEGLLFGEISAITLFNHAWALKPILQHPEWHARLLNGSDYPLPAIMPLISLRHLVALDLLVESHVSFLENLRNYNAFLFDFALKRLIAFEGIAFPVGVFQTRPFF